MGIVSAVDEHDQSLARHRTGSAAGDSPIPLLYLFDGSAARRVLCRADGHGLGAGDGDLRIDPASRLGGRGHGLDGCLYPVADQRGLLSGIDPAWLAAARRLGVAVYLCIRGHAGGIVFGDFSHRFFAQCTGARCLLRDARRRRLSVRLPRRPAARCTSADGRIKDKDRFSSAETCPTTQWSRACGSATYNTAAAAVDAKPSSTTGTRPSRAAMTAPVIAANSRPPSRRSTSKGSLAAGRWHAIASPTAARLASRAAPATPDPGPVHISASPPNSPPHNAAAVVVLPMPISPSANVSIPGSTAIIP